MARMPVWCKDCGKPYQARRRNTPCPHCTKGAAQGEDAADDEDEDDDAAADSTPSPVAIGSTTAGRIKATPSPLRSVPSRATRRPSETGPRKSSSSLWIFVVLAIAVCAVAGLGAMSHRPTPPGDDADDEAKRRLMDVVREHGKAGIHYSDKSLDQALKRTKNVVQSERDLFARIDRIRRESGAREEESYRCFERLKPLSMSQESISDEGIRSYFERVVQGDAEAERVRRLSK